MHGERACHHVDAPQVHPRHQHAWWACRRLQGRTGVTRSPITYPYRPSTPFLLLASAPHTVDLPSPGLPPAAPETAVARRDADSPELACTGPRLFVVSMGVAWTVEVTGYHHLPGTQGRWEQ